MKHLLFAIVLMIACGNVGADSVDDAYQQLLNLEGVWHGKYEQYDMKLTYEAISGEAALMEVMESAGTTMTTIYHRHGDKLMATHYCRFANQPRLVAAVPDRPGNELEFHFLDGTNIGKSYMSDVTFRFVGENQMEQTTKFFGHDTVAKVLYTRAQ